MSEDRSICTSSKEGISLLDSEEHSAIATI